MSERGSAHTSERENSYWRSSFMSLGFTAAIGAHSIFEEVAGFSRLWFPQGMEVGGVFSFMVFCLLCLLLCMLFS